MLNWTPWQRREDFEPDAPGGGRVALAVGGAGGPCRVLIDGACGARLILAGFDRLDAELLARHRPGLVLTWAVGRDFDAHELALRLAALSYRGRLLVLADALPSTDLLRIELAQACPDLAVEVLPASPEGADLLRAV